MSEMQAAQREVLRALCDTVVPAVAEDPDPDGFFARRASDLGVATAIEGLLATLAEEDRSGLLQLLDALAGQGFVRSSQRSREQILRNVALTGPLPAFGVRTLVAMTLFLYYGLPDAAGQNPNWKTLTIRALRWPPPKARGRSSRSFRMTAPRSRPTCASWARARAAA